jgi:hypothetical protein
MCFYLLALLPYICNSVMAYSPNLQAIEAGHACTSAHLPGIAAANSGA